MTSGVPTSKLIEPASNAASGNSPPLVLASSTENSGPDLGAVDEGFAAVPWVWPESELKWLVTSLLAENEPNPSCDAVEYPKYPVAACWLWDWT